MRSDNVLGIIIEAGSDIEFEMKVKVKMKMKMKMRGPPPRNKIPLRCMYSDVKISILSTIRHKILDFQYSMVFKSPLQNNSSSL
jgi:hypothetical protein